MGTSGPNAPAVAEACSVVDACVAVPVSRPRVWLLSFCSGGPASSSCRAGVWHACALAGVLFITHSVWICLFITQQGRPLGVDPPHIHHNSAAQVLPDRHNSMACRGTRPLSPHLMAWHFTRRLTHAHTYTQLQQGVCMPCCGSTWPWLGLHPDCP